MTTCQVRNTFFSPLICDPTLLPLCFILLHISLLLKKTVHSNVFIFISKMSEVYLSASGNQYTYSAFVIKRSSLQSFKINLRNLLIEITWQGNGVSLVSIPEGHSVAPSSRTKPSVLCLQPLRHTALQPFAGQRLCERWKGCLMYYISTN